MASLAQVSYEDAKALPQNNKGARVYKFQILSGFIPQDAVEQDGDAFHGSGGIIENFNGYNARTMNQIIAEAIAIIDAAQQGVYQPQSPTYSPTTPPSMSRQSSMADVDMEDMEPLHINIPSSSISISSLLLRRDIEGGVVGLYVGLWGCAWRDSSITLSAYARASTCAPAL